MTDGERWHGGAGSAERTELSCASVMAEVWTFLDGECTGPVQAEFCEHLSTCTECLDRYVLEGRVKRLIATKCGGDRAPDRIRWLS